MKKIWTANLSFGLVSIPVGLVTAQGDTRSGFSLLHNGDGKKPCGCKINLHRVCPTHGKIEWADVVHGVPTGKDEWAPLDEDVLASLLPEKTGELAVGSFAPMATIDPLLVDRTYWLQPEEAGARSYALFHGA